jgi:hypothetical protein
MGRQPEGTGQCGWPDNGAQCLVWMYGNSIQFVQGRLAILAMYQWVDKGYALQVAYYFHDHDTLVDRERRIYLVETYGRRILEDV